ncbi:MAG: GAF domain-containing protein [Spirochaetaceae bacterium]|nr:MAG: GAF domain-containing protein [Spirochaetaceae bacterium]
MTADRLQTLYDEASAILRENGSPGARLHRMCDYLRQRVSRYDWVGFYVAVPGERTLVLGPFSGQPTEHLRIAFGQGVCGQAADREQTVIVQDVAAEKNYLSCSVHVKSEIVVPVFFEGRLIGELDIDSHSAEAFNDHDRALLERLAADGSGLVLQVAPQQ